jgi:hypothetical protein
VSGTGTAVTKRAAHLSLAVVKLMKRTDLKGRVEAENFREKSLSPQPSLKGRSSSGSESRECGMRLKS